MQAGRKSDTAIKIKSQLTIFCLWREAVCHIIENHWEKMEILTDVGPIQLYYFKSSKKAHICIAISNVLHWISW